MAIIPTKTPTTTECEQAICRLLSYCRSEGWIGYDPYDGLSSPLSSIFPFNLNFTRTVLTQVIKHSPVNFRPAIGIRKSANAKGIALAARAIELLITRYGGALPSKAPDAEAYEISSSRDAIEGLLSDFNFLIKLLFDLRSEGYREACWGYNFDWQSRAFFAPRGTPNVVCTVFAAHAYLDWYDKTGSEQALAVATSGCRFLLDQINRSEAGEGFCFSYTPLDQSRVHNVNLLAAELLARLFLLNKSEPYRVAAEKATRYSLARQMDDGSWPYGEASSQGWIDSFHTGFLLVSLKRIIEYLGNESWRPHLINGYKFYKERFFLADSTPGYYHDRLYPIDAHSAAQAVITFVEMAGYMPEAEEMAKSAVKWAVCNLQDPAGFFYFQRHRFYTIKIPYMRWAQAWMLYALSFYLSKGLARDDI